MIRIRAKGDGTYTVFRNDNAIVSNLTRDEARAAAQSLGTIVIEKASN